MNAEQSTVVGIADGISVKLTYSIPASRYEALERLRECLGDQERSSPLLRTMDVNGIRAAFSEWLADEEECLAAIEDKHEDEVFYAIHS